MVACDKVANPEATIRDCPHRETRNTSSKGPISLGSGFHLRQSSSQIVPLEVTNTLVRVS